MEEKYNQVEVEALFNHMSDEVLDHLNHFEKTLGYKQLSYSEQQATRDIVTYLGEFMFDYHLQTLDTWNEIALQDVLIAIFPTKINADYHFFEKVQPVLTKYFEFLYFHCGMKKALRLTKNLDEITVLMLNEVSLNLKESNQDQLFELGQDMGIDTSDLNDVEKLLRMVQLFDVPKKDQNIIFLSQIIR